MSFKNVDSPRARELLDGDEGYTYLDVRSVPEFENGHPAGAVNIPLVHHDRGAAVPNPDFLRVVETHFDRSAKIIVGTPRAMVALWLSIRPTTTCGSNRLTRTIRQPACSEPRVNMPQPLVWNIGMGLIQVVRSVTPQRPA